MAKIISYRGKRVVFGLDWNLLAGEKTEEVELREAAREAEAAYQVRFANQHSTSYGFLSKEDIAEKSDKADKLAQYVSASMLFATIEGIAKDAVWIEVVDGLARMAVLEGGAPSPSGDFCGAPEEAEAIISRLLETEGREFTFYGEHSQNFVDVFVPLTLEALLDGGDIEASTLQPSKKSAGKNAKLLVLLGLVAAVGVGFIQYQKYAEEQKMLELQKMQQNQNPNAAYKLALERAIPSAGVPSSNVADVFFAGWGQQEVSVAGWELGSVECTPSDCTYKWTVKYGTNEALVKALGKKDYKFSIGGTEATYSIPHTTTQTKKLQVENLPTFSNFMIDTGSFFQNLRLIQAGATIADLSFFAAETGINMAAVTSPVKTGKVTITAKLGLLKDVVSKLPDSVTFQKLVIKTENKETTFTLEGNYYVKN
jgi:hypothetical protein